MIRESRNHRHEQNSLLSFVGDSGAKKQVLTDPRLSRPVWKTQPGQCFACLLVLCLEQASSL